MTAVLSYHCHHTTFINHRAVCQYQSIKIWFSGAYGTVYKARDTLSDTIVAIKKVKSTLKYVFHVLQQKIIIIIHLILVIPIIVGEAGINRGWCSDVCSSRDLPPQAAWQSKPPKYCQVSYWSTHWTWLKLEDDKKNWIAFPKVQWTLFRFRDRSILSQRLVPYDENVLLTKHSTLYYKPNNN